LQSEDIQKYVRSEQSEVFAIEIENPTVVGNREYEGLRFWNVANLRFNPGHYRIDVDKQSTAIRINEFSFLRLLNTDVA